MKRTNIQAVLKMVRGYLDGHVSRIELSLDFPYELEQRYEKMRSEDPEYSELIYDRLLEEGVYRAEPLSDEKYRELIRRQYEDVIDIANGGFL
jgi:hypothetical protein